MRKKVPSNPKLILTELKPEYMVGPKCPSCVEGRLYIEDDAYYHGDFEDVYVIMCYGCGWGDSRAFTSFQGASACMRWEKEK